MKADEWAREHYLTVLQSTPHLNVEEIGDGLMQLGLRLIDAAAALDEISKREEETWLT